MLITFEGVDGSGKSTQIELLANYLKERKINYISIREPGGTSLSEAIRNILLNPEYDISPITELLLFNAARSNLVEKVIRPALNSNILVICDRFYDSTTAYQGYGHLIDFDKVQMCNYISTRGIVPDITFLFDLDWEVAKSRINPNNLDRIELLGDEFFRRVVLGFREISSNNNSRFVIIDATDRIENIHKKIIEKLLEKNII